MWSKSKATEQILLKRACECVCVWISKEMAKIPTKATPHTIHYSKHWRYDTAHICGMRICAIEHTNEGKNNIFVCERNKWKEKKAKRRKNEKKNCTHKHKTQTHVQTHMLSYGWESIDKAPTVTAVKRRRNKKEYMRWQRWR